VATLIELDQAAFTCPIHFEILSGAHDSEIELVKETFALIERHPFRPEFWDRAADLDRRLRKKGVTIPRDDLFIAVAADRLGLTLVCKDKHFVASLACRMQRDASLALSMTLKGGQNSLLRF